MKERSGDRWVPVLLSVLFHGSLVAVLGWSWWHWRDQRPTPAPTLAIEATVVTSDPPAAAPPAPTPAPTPEPEAVPTPPPPDDTAKQHELEAAQAAEKQAALQRESEKREAEKRAAEQQAADEKAAAERAAREQAQRQAEAAKQKLEKEKLAQQQAQAAAARQKLESDLRAQLAAEERLNAARASGQQAQYAALIRARIERAWIRPPSARAGLNCEVRVTQVPGGEVTGVQIGACNGDEAVRGSIEAAVYRASPLPTPENAELFERNLVFNFKPND